MFHWICPECGQEIAPGVKECPVCEPQASPEPLLPRAPSAKAASTLEPAAAVFVLEPQGIRQREVVFQPEVFEKPEPRIIPEVRPLDEPPELETFADRLADLAERLHGEHIPYAAHRIIPSTVVPLHEADRAAVVLDLTPSTPLLAPPPTVRLLAEPQPPSVAAEIPVREVFRPRAAAQAVRSRPPAAAEPSELSGGLGPVRLPDRPGRMAAPAFAPFQDYCQAADRQMRPAAYPTKAVASATEPKVTLPGPALPRELMSLQAAGLVPLWRARRDAAAPNRYGWKTRMAVMAILLTAGLAATYRVMPGNPANVPVKPAPEPAPEQPVPARSRNPLARSVEVTGIRFLEVNKKPQIHYLVVNHSSAPLGSVTVLVTLRASNAKPGQPPLARLTFRSPNLAAFEAKEMFSSIERASGPFDLPDWQDLRTDVEVQ